MEEKSEDLIALEAENEALGAVTGALLNLCNVRGVRIGQLRKKLYEPPTPVFPKSSKDIQ